MAKKTKNETAEIVGLGADDSKLIVQKSLPLFALWRSGLSLAEFKILDTYLARIDSRHPEKRVVTFEKGELERVLGVKDLSSKDLRARLTHLMEHVVALTDDSKKGFRLVTLFEEAVAEKDERTGLWIVRMECTQKAMRYFFNVENIGYLRYKLRCITTLTSRYSYILFTYLEHNRYRRSWEISIDDLRHMMGCDEETYSKYKYFHDKVLKRAHAELTSKTDCRFTYEAIKSGRNVIAIRFTVETLADRITAEDPDQITLDQYLAEQAEQEQEQEQEAERALWEEAIQDFKLNDAQYDELRSALSLVPHSKLPDMSSYDLSLFHYVDRKAAEVRRRHEEKPIRNRYTYLLKIVANDGMDREED